MTERSDRQSGMVLAVYGAKPGVGTTVVVVFPAKRVRRDQARLVT